jgi:hypothetical protein
MKEGGKERLYEGKKEKRKKKWLCEGKKEGVPEGRSV